MNSPRAKPPWEPLGAPLGGRQRRELERSLSALLVWQRTLGRFPEVKRAPDATPFVSLHAPGRLAGCHGATEGAPGTRLARAFLRALHDARYGEVLPRERSELVASVSYLRTVRRVRFEDVEARLELGRHGLGVVAGGASSLLLPFVAAEQQADARGLLQLLAGKSGLPLDDARSTLFLFETDAVVARPPAPQWPSPGALCCTISANPPPFAWRRIAFVLTGTWKREFVSLRRSVSVCDFLITRQSRSCPSSTTTCVLQTCAR